MSYEEYRPYEKDTFWFHDLDGFFHAVPVDGQTQAAFTYLIGEGRHNKRYIQQYFLQAFQFVHADTITRHTSIEEMQDVFEMYRQEVFLPQSVLVISPTQHPLYHTVLWGFLYDYVAYMQTDAGQQMMQEWTEMDVISSDIQSALLENLMDQGHILDTKYGRETRIDFDQDIQSYLENDANENDYSVPDEELGYILDDLLANYSDEEFSLWKTYMLANIEHYKKNIGLFSSPSDSEDNQEDDEGDILAPV